MRHLVPFLGSRSVHLLFSRYSSTSFGAKIKQQKFAGRLGGQNLSERYVRLAKSLKGKEHYTGGFDVPSTSNSYGQHFLKADSEATFHGFVIPEAPREPSSEDCCMSGCAICVYDLYEQSLSEYRDSIKLIQNSLTELGVPQSDWPSILSSERSASDLSRAYNASETAFEALERALAAKSMQSIH